MRVGFAQINPTVGDFGGNTSTILSAYTALVKEGADVVLTPELALPGYPPLDLLFKSTFVPRNLAALDALHAQVGEIPLLIGYARTEETLYDRPTAEKLGLDEAGLQKRVSNRIGGDPARVISAFRTAHPEATPWDLWILIATDHPRGTYSRELAKRKAEQRSAPAFAYRYDWETPEGGGHMRSPHTVEIQFVFNNITIAGPLISKMKEAYALAEKTSAAWVAFARTGDPNTSTLPQWPAYSAASRDTMLFNNDCRVVSDPDRGPRTAMEQVLKLS